jgi:hypothetical protein
MRFVSLALVLTAFLVACGGDGGGGGGSGGGSGSEEAQVRRTIDDFAKAFNDGKARDVVALLDAESRKNCKESDISAVLTLLKAFSGSQKFGVEVQKVDVKGERATATILPTIGGEKQQSENQELVKEDGKWRLSFGGGDCGL